MKVFTSWHRKYVQKLPWSIASLIFINIWLLTHVVMLRNKREFISICTRDSAVLPEWDISVIWNSEHASKQGYPKKWRKKKAYLKQFKLYHKILYWEELHKFFLKGNHEQGPVAPSSSQNPLFHAAFTWQITVLQNTERSELRRSEQQGDHRALTLLHLLHTPQEIQQPQYSQTHTLSIWSSWPFGHCCSI